MDITKSWLVVLNILKSFLNLNSVTLGRSESLCTFCPILAKFASILSNCLSLKASLFSFLTANFGAVLVTAFSFIHSVNVGKARPVKSWSAMNGPPSQGLLNQMDRTLRTLAKFESSRQGLILGTQITPRGWIFWTINFYHQKIQVKIYLMRGQT